MPTVTVATETGAVETWGAPAPTNSEIRKIAQDVLDAAMYSLVATAAAPEVPVRENSLEAAYKLAFQKMKPEQMERVNQKAKEIAGSAPARKALFGRYAERDAKEFVSMGFDRVRESLPALVLDRKLLGIKTPAITVPLADLQATGEGLVIPRGVVTRDLESIKDQFEEAQVATVEDGIFGRERLNELYGLPEAAGVAMREEFDDFEAVTRDKLAFCISQVKCVDETNPEWWGSDEISLGGTEVDESGDTKKIPERYVGGGFDDGDTKNYSPHWQLTSFNLREVHPYPGLKWPKVYQVILLMAEKDNGGFASALQRIYEVVGAQVKTAISNAVGGALSTYLGPVIAKAIGEAVAWVVGKLIEWIISLFNDDIFPAYTTTCTISSLTSTFAGSATSPLRTAHFSGHGGHYTVNYYWKLFA